jgi:hypothetical protein
VRVSQSICCLSLLLPVVAFADTVFTDPDLNLANYTATAIYKTPGVTLQYMNCATCGNGGGEGLEELVSTPPSAPGDVLFGLINNSFVYNPQTEGAIDSISAQADENLIFNRTPGGSFTPTFEPLIEQGGNYYIALIYGNPFLPNEKTSGYQTISESGLMNTDFGLINFSTGYYDPSTNPDFSAAGAPLIFGLAPIIEVNDQFQIQADYNNYLVDITPFVSAVPEPGMLAPVALLIICVTVCGFRRNPQSRLRRN